MENFSDKRIRILGITLLLLLDLYTQQVFLHPLGWYTVNAFLEFLFLSTLTWEVTRWILIRFRKKYPSLQQTQKKILIAIPVCWMAAIAVDWLDMLLINLTGLRPAYKLAVFINTIPGALLFTVLIVGIQEAVFYFGRLLKFEKETEELKKINLQTQLESLKQQINPHFLFNSLNSLSYLIGENPEMAEKFLDEMSKVYRYLLRNNEQGLTSLATELQFIRSYFHLLKTRYGESIRLDLAIDSAYEEYLLPPLTLQLLIENAVKHNVVHKDKPLTVRITTHTDGLLTVQNNLQKIKQTEPSTQVGLANIASKFLLLNQPNIKITESNHAFAVTIPLIKN